MKLNGTAVSSFHHQKKTRKPRGQPSALSSLKLTANNAPANLQYLNDEICSFGSQPPLSSGGAFAVRFVGSVTVYGHRKALPKRSLACFSKLSRSSGWAKSIKARALSGKVLPVPKRRVGRWTCWTVWRSFIKGCDFWWWHGTYQEFPYIIHAISINMIYIYIQPHLGSIRYTGIPYTYKGFSYHPLYKIFNLHLTKQQWWMAQWHIHHFHVISCHN